LVTIGVKACFLKVLHKKNFKKTKKTG